MKTIRVFKTRDANGEELIYEFRRPTQAIISKGELVSKARFSEALRAGVILNAEVVKILRDRGLWTDVEVQVEQELREDVVALEEKLHDPGLSNVEGRDLVEQIRAKRLELQEHTSLFQSVSGGTCESISTEERNMFYAAECVYDKNRGQKVYKSLEDFKARLNESVTIDCYREATIASLEVLIGKELPSDLSTQYTENKWLVERGLDSKSEDEPEGVEETPEPKKKARKKRAKKSAPSSE